MSGVLTRETLRRDIEALGVSNGDAVLVRANVGAIGRVRGGLGESLRGALLDAVGETGTIVSLAFTRTFPLLRLDRTYVFDANTPTTSGRSADAGRGGLVIQPVNVSTVIGRFVAQ